MDTLVLDEPAPEDNSISGIEYFPFNPITGTQYNNPGVIQINIENTNDVFFPRRSWLQIEGQLLKDDATVYDKDDFCTLINNGIMYCFSNIKYLLNGTEIESLNHPGHATTMLGMLKYERSYSGLIQCWAPDTITTATAGNNGYVKRRNFIFSSNPVGTFSFGIDLEHIFGFGEDYDKVIMGFRHSLQFSRMADDNNAIFRAHNSAGKVVLSKITWWMPIVEPAELEKNKIVNIIQKESTIQSWFRMRQCAMVSVPTVSSYTWNLGVRTGSERPRYVIVGLQGGKQNSQEQNPAIFDSTRVESMKIRLNNTEYPSIHSNSNFTTNNFAIFYMQMARFNQSFYQLDRMLASTSINADEYKSLFPLFVFDVSKQGTRLSGGVVDISVIMNFAANAPQNTVAFALVISDRKIKFQGNGQKMNVIF